jgi:hypothetical protein
MFTNEKNEALIAQTNRVGNMGNIAVRDSLIDPVSVDEGVNGAWTSQKAPSRPARRRVGL